MRNHAQKQNAKNMQSNDEAKRSGLGFKTLTLLMSIILVMGLIPGLGVSQQAYAAQGGEDAVSTETDLVAVDDTEIESIATTNATTNATADQDEIVTIADDDLPGNVRIIGTWNIGADPDHEDALTATIYIDDVQSEVYFVVAGQGDAKTFENSDEVPWCGDNARHINYVIFEEGPEITCLDYWFADCIRLMETPVIPETVTSLNSTFYGCTSLTVAPYIPAGVTDLTNAFYGCTELNTLPDGFAIPAGATTTNAFYVGDPYSADNLRWTTCSTADYETLLAAYEWQASNRYLSAEMLGQWEIGSPVASDVTAMLTLGGELEISGTGDVVHYASPDDIPWYAQGFAGDITSVSFGEGVTPIYLDYLFTSCSNLTVAPEIPDSVLSMVSTFEYCTSMTLPENYTLPSNLVDMSATFTGCSSLTLPTGFTIPDSVVSLADTFYDCASLELPEDFTLPSQVIFLDYAFAWSGITSVPANFVIPESATSASYMFYYCMSLTSIGEGFRLGENVTTIDYMFNYCSVLEALPDGFAIPDSVTNMNRAFERCFALTELPAGFTIGAGVEDMSYAFYYCSHLESLPVGFTIPDSVVDMDNAFNRCSVLASLPAGFTIGAGVEDMSSAFYNCDALTELPAGFAIPEGAVATNAFYVGGSYSSSNPCYTYCDDDDYAALSAYDWEGDNRRLISDKNRVALAIYSADDNSLTFYRGAAPSAGNTYNGKTATAVYTGFESRNYSWSNIPWNSYRSSIKSVVTDPSFADVRPVSCAYWFFDFYYCTSMNLTYLDTSAVTSMDSMFENCYFMEDFDVSGFDTSAVSNMEWMFAGCLSLETLDVSSFNTSNVTNMYAMFDGCCLLEELDVSNFDTSNVTNMGAMFEGCLSLTSIDLSNFDTSSVQQIYYLFDYCTSLTSLDLSNFDTSHVDDLSGMFAGCTSLVEVDTTGWDTSSVLYMYGVFYGCTSLVSLDLSGWDTSSVQYMESMFMGCTALESLNLSGWDTRAVEDGALFLMQSDAIKDITIGDAFDLFAKYSVKITDIQMWFDEEGNVVSDDYMRGVSGAGTYYTYVNINENMFEVDATGATYTGARIEAAITSDLEEGVDYVVEYADNVNVGTATMTITGVGSYGGTLTYEFAIEPADVTITCMNMTKVYGDADPTLNGIVEGLVKYGDLGEIVYSRAEGEDAGTYEITATYTPNANYSVTVIPGTLTIVATPEPEPAPTEITPDMFSVDLTNVTYTGSPIEPTVTSDLELDTDYTVEYTNNVNAGTATITIIGLEPNYIGTIAYNFTIERALTRLAGDDRYSTMQAEATEGFENADTVVLTAGSNFPDALSAAGLAGTLNAPVLLTATDTLSSETAEEIARLGANRVVIVGGESSVSAAVANELTASGLTVERIAGTDRYATALAAYNAGADAWGTSGHGVKTAIIAAGASFADTLSASSYAWWATAPIFLSSSNGIDEGTRAAIEDAGFERIIIVGGTASVPTSVEAWSRTVTNTERISGDDRYATSITFATWAQDEGMSFNDAGIATGKNFPDALAGGALCGSRGSVVLLADADSISGIQMINLLAAHKDEISRVYYLGGTNSVTPALATLIEAVLK